MIIQSTDLVLVAQGSHGRPARWIGPPLEDGIHLRWAFPPAFGFPGNGFTLYRRPHVPGHPLDLPVEGLPDLITLPELARRVAGEFVRTRPWVERAMGVIPWLGRTDASAPRLVGFFASVPVGEATATVSRGQVVVELDSDAIDSVRIDTRGWRLKALRYVPVLQDADTGWQRVGTICLPVTDPRYPCGHGQPTDWQCAAGRIPGEVTERYLGSAATPSSNWQALHDLLHSLFNPPIPGSEILPTTVDGTPPAAGIGPTDLLLLSSVDLYIARILGLYWLDMAAAPGQVYDYRVVGNWVKTQLKAPELVIDFDEWRRGHHFPNTFLREGLIFRSLNAAVLSDAPDPPWRDTRWALDLGHLTDPGTDRPVYLRIQFESPVAEAQLYLRCFAGRPQIRASTSGITLSRWESADHQFLILSAAAVDRDQSIEYLTIDPAPDSSGLHLALCKVGFTSAWSPPMGEQLAWISCNVRAAPTSLTAPSGVVVKSLRASGRELPNGGLASGPLAGLRWTVPSVGDALLPRQPVRYLIERQSLGSGPAPAAVDAIAWHAVTQIDHSDEAVMVPATTEAQYMFIDDPGAALGQNQAERFYAYRVAGVDLFGRVTPFSEPAVGDFSDRQGPPSPLDVEARYLDPTDPHLTTDEWEWVHGGDSPRSGLHVRWAWPPSLRRQAPDAREVRIYVQEGRLNTITGRITDGAPNPDGTFTVITDQTLITTTEDAFAGEWLLSGGAYFMVVHNTTGPTAQVTVRPPEGLPPAVPLIGPFTLNIRPPQAFEGTVNFAQPHLNGTVTLRTDQTISIPDNATWLRQRGRDFQILGSSTHGRLRILVRGAGRPARVPGKGKFALMEEIVDEEGRTVLTPALADGGSGLWIDYRRPEQWTHRAHVEPLAEPISGSVMMVTVDHAAGTTTVIADQALQDPEHRFDRGTLVNTGRLFPVVAHTEGPGFQLTVANLREPDGTILTPSPGPFEYHVGYRKFISFSFAESGEEPVVSAHVGASAADDKDYVPDHPRWNGTPLGDRPGNESTVSPPVLVQNVLRGAMPDRLPAPDAGDGLATAADYYGRSSITLRWTRQEGMRYEVYRALDEAIFATDSAVRSTRSTDRLDYSWLTDAAFEAVVAHAPEYGALSEDFEDEFLQALAGLPGNDAAFNLITPEPLESDSYTASFDGRARNRYCFALKLVDRAGNRSQLLGWPSRPIHAPITLPPRAPAVSKILGGERKIILTWASNREPDLKEYRVYRADTEEKARDLRLMELVHTELIPPGGPDTRPADVSWPDTSVDSLQPYRYRIVALDGTGNLSVPSAALVAQAFDQAIPEPSVWSAARWNADGSGIELTWTSPDPNARTIVQRRDAEAWQAVSPWLPGGVNSFADMTADGSIENRYRLRVWNESGNLSTSYQEIAVPPR